MLPSDMAFDQSSSVPDDWRNHPAWNNRTVAKLSANSFDVANQRFVRTNLTGRRIAAGAAATASVYKQVFWVFFAIGAEKSVDPGLDLVNQDVGKKGFCASEDFDSPNQETNDRTTR